MPPTRLMLIENSIGLSGSTVSLCTLVRHLNRARYAPVIVFSREEQQAYFAAHDDRVTVSTVIRCRPSLRARGLTGRTLRLCRRLGRRWERPAAMLVSALDLVFVISPYVARLYAFARKHRVTLIHHNNGFDVAAVLLARLLGVPIVAYQRGAEWNSPLVRYLARFVTRYIANSETTARSLGSLGVPSTKLDVIYPPIDLGMFDHRRPAGVSRRTFGVPDAAPCVGILGTLLEWKGHRVFLHAMQRVATVVPEAIALIVGGAPDGDRRYPAELLALTRELGLEDRVIFTGFRTDIPDVLQVLDVVVHASLTPEPFGRVIAEAMAMKRPVVAMRAGGPTEVIEDGRNGRLVTPGDPVELAAAIVELLADRPLALRLGEHARTTAFERFSAVAHAAHVDEIYEQATAAHVRPRTTAPANTVRVS